MVEKVVNGITWILSDYCHRGHRYTPTIKGGLPCRVCRACEKIYRLKNKERRREYYRLYRSQHRKEHAEYMKDYMRGYRAEKTRTSDVSLMG